MQNDPTFDEKLGSRRAGAAGTAGDAPALDQLRERADHALDNAADTLDHAARKVDALAELLPGHGFAARAGSFGHGAADTLESVARFLRDKDIDTLQHDLGRLVSGRPVTMLLLAVGTGFVVGKALR